MSMRSTPTPRRDAERSDRAQRPLTSMEVTLLIAALALALSGQGSITASGDVTTITTISLLPTP